MQAQAHNAPIMSVPRRDKPAYTAPYIYDDSSRLRSGVKHCFEKKNIAENAGCFLGHRKICFRFPEGN